ncbi:hypothetical protein BGX28_004835 [Mortierella sp. GBA30]|nr:hypothetical protein BGX28_004835 [Mortierella sp. GBA30]
MVNRGQCVILLQELVSLGQLAWLRPNPTKPALLVTVLYHIICEPDSDESSALNLSQQQDNFVDFVLGAMDKKSPADQLLLNPTEFLQWCAVPLLDSLMRGEKAAHLSFRAVVTILQRLYEPTPVIQAVSGSWISHGIHFQILQRVLQLRSLESPWTADRRGRFFLGHQKTACKSGRKDDGGQHLEYISRLCELCVSRLASHVRSTPGMEESDRAKLRDLVDALMMNDSLIDLESKLLLVPLLNACGSYLETEVRLPELPRGIEILCGDRLQMFEYCPTDTVQASARASTASEALFLALSAARMCDEAMQDITQALLETPGYFPSLQHDLETMFAPVLYRILSISSRSECHRLLTQGVPCLLRLWPGSSNKNRFWKQDVAETAHCLLGPYWKDFAQGQVVQVPGAADKNIISLNAVLAVLRMSETLLRFAMEPVPQMQRDNVMQVYSLEVGYNMLVDQMASLVQSSLKIDWSVFPLDHVLYCFMMVCKMSAVVFNPDNSSGIQKRDQTVLDPQDEQELVTRSKARDELVLMAMNISEEIVRRVDVYLSAQETTELGKGSTNGIEVYSSQGTQERSRGAHSDRLSAKGTSERKDSRAGDDYPSPTPSNTSTQLTTTGMDEGTQAWFNNIMAPALGRSVQKLDPRATSSRSTTPGSASSPISNAVAVEAGLACHEEKIGDFAPSPLTPLVSSTTQVKAPPSSGLCRPDDSEVSTDKGILTADQAECLMLGLKYLPVQEQHAVKTRLSRTLPP